MGEKSNSSAVEMGIAGLDSKGRFFVAPDFVNLKNEPGTTPQPKTSVANYFKNLVTFKFFFVSPNFVWAVIALAVYVLFPYDLESPKHGWGSWVWDRCVLNFVVVFGYYIASWGVIYVLRVPKRKFDKEHWPSAQELAHDVWYLTLGTLQWCGWEVVMMRLWATGVVGHMSNSEVWSSWSNLLQTSLCFMLVPAWRGFHFYTAHRFIHIRAVYKFVHSLHHRNTDPNPWSGLAMHPIEHLYYYSCIGPHLLLPGSPLLFLFNGMHLLLSPAFSHSGWEDHWQSDQFHFVHHARFECNYGGGGDFFDHMFGTFYDQYKPKATGTKPSSSPSAAPASIVLTSPPASDHLAYSAFTCALFYVAWRMCLFVAAPVSASGFDLFLLNLLRAYPVMFGLLVSVGPVAAAYLLWASSKDSLPARWPFQKEAILGAFGFHAVAGGLVVLLPVFGISYGLAIS
eukprot:c7445_g1_i2.p1 GENE.c7445_g1_i2~~c7445_g1_i2.p1  ORF type:complete len:454 (+),score=113.39 c7445_g1_i2:1-1362(+)